MIITNAWVAGVKSVSADDVNILFWADDPLKRESKYIVKSDEEINYAIVDAMLYDPRVSTFDIDVEVENGYVTLNGTVDNLKAKRSAEADAANAIGVVGVKNKIKVRPEIDFEDDDIEKNIEKSFEIDPILDENKFEITVTNNKAYLYGHVDNYSEKMHASNVASLILGVADVENNIEVIKDWKYKTDRMIKEDIEDEFFWSFLVDGDDINVTVENGIVTLTGEVESLPEFRAAVDNAFEGGAKRVHSKLDIVSNDDYGYRMYYPNYPLYHYTY
jgi:osmotically-inducible protein OsmY